MIRWAFLERTYKMRKKRLRLKPGEKLVILETGRKLASKMGRRQSKEFKEMGSTEQTDH